jgi:hypothetical protein
MGHPLQCRCGTIKGSVEHPRSANRAVCYCKDCQAFAHYLGRPGDVLDERGGSDVIQVLPRLVTFSAGVEALACLRLTPKGLLRWYAGCCRTPIGNTAATPKLSFIGLVHNCLEGTGGESLDSAFGPVGAWVNTQSAQGDPKPESRGIGTTFSWFLRTVLKARCNGDYRRTPFFRADTGLPIVVPKILSGEEHATVMSCVRNAAPPVERAATKAPRD